MSSILPGSTSLQKGSDAMARMKSDLSRADLLAKKLAKVMPDEDPAVVAGALVIVATENIKRSAQGLPDARAYLKGMHDAIDGLLVNAFPPKDAPKQPVPSRRPARKR